MLALDTETRLITEAEPVPQLVSLALAGGHGTSLFHQSDPYLSDVVRESLRGGWVSANVAFDAFVLWRKFPLLLGDMIDAYNRGAVVDLLVQEKLIRISLGERAERISLGRAVKERLGWELDKSSDVRVTFGDLIDVPLAEWPEASRRYATDDATAHWCLWLVQRHIAEPRVLDPAPEITRTALALHGISLTGMATDQDRVAELEARLSAEVDAFRAECVRHGLVVDGKRKRAPVQALLGKLAEQGARVRKTASGLYSTSEDALREMAIPRCEIRPGVGVVGGHPLDAYRRLGSRQTQLAKVQKRKGPIFRTNFDELKVTGRMGASGFSPKGAYGFWAATSDNGQNTPKEPGFRECQRARDGHVLIASDWGAVELVCGAQIQLDWFRRSRLADVLREGRDPHSEMGATILGIPPESFDRHGNPEHAKARQLAKAPNFGFPGLLGAARFVGYAAQEPYSLTLTENEARELKRAWETTWPEWVMYLNGITRALVPGVTRQAGGRLRVVGPRTGIIRGGCRVSEACNFPFQGLAAMACRRATWRTWMACLDPRSPIYGCKLVLVVHDELVLEAPEDRKDEALAELERIMLAALAECCPDVPGKVESNVMRNYRK